MSLTLNNIATADDYTDANTIQDRVCDRVNIIITGDSGIYYQLQAADMDGRGPNIGAWLPERFLPGEPSGGNFAVSLSRRCSGLRVRSGTAGSPATVTAEIVPADQLGSAVTPQ